jgi:hypothetical protein
MPVCRKCGSTRTQIIGGAPLERVLAGILRQRVVFCGRCGWRGRVPISSGVPHSGRRRRHQQAADSGSVREPVSTVDLDAIEKGLDSSPVSDADLEALDQGLDADRPGRRDS